MQIPYKVFVQQRNNKGHGHVLHWQESAINPPKTHKRRDINAITAAAGFNTAVEIKLSVP